jgi:hypothetical protein
MNTLIITERSFKEEAITKIQAITHCENFDIVEFTVNDFVYQVIHSDPKFGVNGSRELHINCTHINEDGSGERILRSVKTATFTFQNNVEIAREAIENLLGRTIAISVTN